MRAVIIALALNGANALSSSGSEFLLRERFAAWKLEHGKSYESEDEHNKRLINFEQSIERIAELNEKLAADGEEMVHGITRFADLSQEEFKSFLGVVPSMHAETLPVLEAHVNVSAVSGSFNWNDQGVLTPVKDQAQCGSCWAFSAVSTIESAWIRAGNDMTIFSEQQVVSCDSTDNGCSGGLPTNAFEYVKSAGGLATEDSYPYTSGTGDSGTCQSFTTAGGTVSSYGYAVPQCTKLFGTCDEDSDALASALQSNGPISVALDASEWSSYAGGVMTSSSCSSSSRKMDHAVQLVGYNADADTPYWIVRNSWSASWGEEGFIYLKMGDNTCGIANLAAQVTAV